jgi:hypothetical protein
VDQALALCILQPFELESVYSLLCVWWMFARVRCFSITLRTKSGKPRLQPLNDRHGRASNLFWVWALGQYFFFPPFTNYVKIMSKKRHPW